MADKKITIVIGGDASGATKAFDDATGGGNKLSGTLTKMAGAVAGLEVVRKGIDFIKESMAAASAEQENLAVLNGVLDNTVHATDAQRAANEKWITSMQNATGISRDELAPAEGKLLIAGRSLEQAHKDLAVAADIAAARHIDLSSVVQAMSKAAQGSTGALQKLGVATKDAAGNALDFDQILQAAEKTMGGSAAAAADTLAGRQKIMALQFDDLKIKIGDFLIPVMEKLTAVITKLVEWVSTMDTKTLVIIGTIGGLVAVFASTVAVLGAVTDAAALFGVTLTLALGPIALVVAAVAAVAAGVIYAYFHFDAFRRVVDAVVGFVKAQVVPAIQLLTDVFKFLADGAVTAFNWIIDAVDGAWKFLEPIFKKITDGVNAVTGALSHIPGGFLGGAASAVAGPLGNFIPGHNAAGTSNWPGGLSWVGENGPELVNLPTGSQVIPNHALGGNNYSIMVTVAPGGDLGEAGRQMVDAIRVFEQRNGPGWRS